MTINKNRRTERAAVNALRSLLEANDHIVQEIDGGNDHGEDLYITFTEGGERTGDTIAVQVKGGRSVKTKIGYRVPVGGHATSWRKSNVAIVCVVQDVDTGMLHWANASRQLREAETQNTSVRSIRVRPEHTLDGPGIDRFVRSMRSFIAETGDLHRFLSKISGGTFDTTDYLSYFENVYGEQLIFQQRRGAATAWLWHSDLGWKPREIAPESLQFGRPDAAKRYGLVSDILANLITVGDVIINESEALWLGGCFIASDWHREQPRVHPL